MSAFDRAAETWLRMRIPDANPDPGSVRFVTDCAAYASGGWAHVDVEWTENGRERGEELIPDAWDADLTTIIREIVEIDPA